MKLDPPVRSCTESFVRALAELLGDRMLSVYLFGSAVLGDYRAGWSDLDLICFTAEPIPPEKAEELLTLRQSLVQREKNPLYRTIEGAAVCFDEFRTKPVSHAVYWGTSGQRITDSYSLDVFSRFGLIRYGALLFGLEMRDRLPLPARSELVAGIERHYNTIRTYARETNGSLYSCGWLLDIARCLYTLRYGDLISKTEAGRWALAEGLCPCPDDVTRALAVRLDPIEAMKKSETRDWLRSLGASVQRFADVLEKALNG